MEPSPFRSTAFSRRRLVQTAAAAAAGLSGSLALPAAGAAHAADHGEHARDVVPPKPIPGGIVLPDGSQIHAWGPGDVTLPISGGPLMGLDVDPATLTDFNGFAAASFHAGTATGTDGATFALETDMRAFKGTYLDGTGTRRFGTFAFI